MLAKSPKVWLAIAFVALTLYATVLLYTPGSLREIPKYGWTHAGNAADAEAATPPKEPAHPHARPPPASPDASPPAEAPAASLPAGVEPELAIATFLTGQASDDTYYNSTRLLVYQLLHAPETRIKNPNITFVVMCGKKLAEEKKERLRLDGATVITLDDVKLPDWIPNNFERWSEQFTKLRAFELTQYKRFLYIDADYYIMHPMDDIFEDPIVQQLNRPLFSRKDKIMEDEGALPDTFLFAARSENGGVDGFDHQVPPLQTVYANGGFFLIAPDKKMFEHLMNVMKCKDRFPTTFMEQDMLNYVFKREGPMPWRELDWKWSANFVNEKDVEFGVHSLHGKFWGEGPKEVQQKWRQSMNDMMEWEENMSH